MAWSWNPQTGELDFGGTVTGGTGVTSVNGDTGPVVVLDTDDIPEGVVNFYLTTERVQDIVGAFVVNTATVTWVYNDVANTLEATAITTTPTGTPNTFAGYDALGDLYSLPSWNWSPDTNGASFINSLTPANPGVGTTHFINDFQTYITPTADLTNLGYVGMRNYFDLNGPEDFSNFQAINTQVNAPGLGDKGTLTLHSDNYNLGDGTNISTSISATVRNVYSYVANLHTLTNNFTGENHYLQVALGGTVGYVQGANYSIQIDGQSLGNSTVQNLSASVTANQPAGVGITIVNSNSTIDGNLQFVNGFGMFPNIGQTNPVTITQGIQGFSYSVHGYTGATFNGHTGFSDFSQYDAGTILNGGFNGISIQPNIAGTMAGNGYNGVNVGGNFSNAMDFFNILNLGGNLNAGVVVANGIQPFGENTQVNNTVTADYYTGVGIFPRFYPTSNVDQIQFINVSPTYESTLSDSVTLANFNITGAGTAGTVTGININIGTGNINSPVKQTAITSQGGSAGFFYDFKNDVITFNLADQIHSMGGTFHIMPGVPLAGGEFIFGNLMGHQVIIEDDMGVDVLGGVIGFSMNASVGQYAVADTKTMDTFNLNIAGGSIPDVSGLGITDGGTMTNVSMYRAIGLLPQGGTLLVTNMYGFKIDSLFDSIGATNLWGVHVDSDAENWFKASIAVGTASQKVANASVGIELESTTKAILNSRMTTAQRNALTALGGMQIFNTDLTRLEFYDGASWITL